MPLTGIVRSTKQGCSPAAINDRLNRLIDEVVQEPVHDLIICNRVTGCD